MPDLFFVIPAYSRSCYMPDCIWFLSRHPKGKNKGKVNPKKLMLYINNNNLPCFWIFVLAFKIILMNVDIKILKSFFLPVSMSRGVQGDKARDIILRVVTSGPFFVFPDRSNTPWKNNNSKLWSPILCKSLEVIMKRIISTPPPPPITLIHRCNIFLLLENRHNTLFASSEHTLLWVDLWRSIMCCHTGGALPEPSVSHFILYYDTYF